MSSQKMGAWPAEGTIRYDETVVDGLEDANTGKMLVRIQDSLPAAAQRLPAGNKFSTIRKPGAGFVISTWSGDSKVTFSSVLRRSAARPSAKTVFQ